MKKSRIALWLTAILLPAIVFIQNTESVETRVLFMTLSMPRAVLLFTAFSAGFVAGTLTMMMAARRKARAGKGPV